MIKVEAGTFNMGDEEDGDELLHKVIISHDYYIGETLVTGELVAAILSDESIADEVKKHLEDEKLHLLGDKPNDTIKAIYFGVEADMNSSLFRTLIMFAQTNDIPCFKMERSLSEYKLQFHSIS